MGYYSWLAAGALTLALGCGGSSKKAETKPIKGGGDTTTSIPKVDPTLCDTKGKKVQTFDLNRDERPDVWKLYKQIREGGAQLDVLTCKQVDFDHDGKKDYVAAYSKKGAMLFEKYDFDFDGKFDAFARYEEKTGELYQVERDTDFDGKYDVVERYDEKGVLTSVRRDRNGDSTPDQWEQYVNGQLVAILYDDDFDRKVDRKDEIQSMKPKSNLPSEDDTKPPADDGDGDGDKTDAAGDKPAAK